MPPFPLFAHAPGSEVAANATFCDGLAREPFAPTVAFAHGGAEGPGGAIGGICAVQRTPPGCAKGSICAASSSPEVRVGGVNGGICAVADRLWAQTPHMVAFACMVAKEVFADLPLAALRPGQQNPPKLVWNHRCRPDDLPDTCWSYRHRFR